MLPSRTLTLWLLLTLALIPGCASRKSLEEPERRRLTGNLFFEDVKQVLSGASKRVRSMHFRNDEEIEALGRFAERHEHLREIPIHNARFVCHSGTSLSWALTEREGEAIFQSAERALETEEFRTLRPLLE